MNKKTRFILIHGTEGSPASNWLPWLTNSLQLKGQSVSVPSFPTPEGQSQSNWLKAFRKQVAPIDSETVLIGHSMGVGLILRVLEQSEVPAKGCLFVSGWTGLLNNPEFDPLIASFFEDVFSWPRVIKNGGQIQLFHGSDDPYVPLTMAKDLSNSLDAPLEIVSNGGHLNQESGFVEFPKLLDCALKFTV